MNEKSTRKKQLPKDSPVHVTMASSEPPTCRLNVDLVGQEKYMLWMKNIIDTNTNLDQFTDLEISCCTLELAGDQVPIAGAIRRMKNLTTLRLDNIELCSSTFLEIESKELKQLYLRWCKTQLEIASLFKNDLCYKDSLVELRLGGNQWSEVPNGIFQFRNLLKLSLSRNLITELPDKFTNLLKLQVVSLSYNRLTRVPPSIFEMQNLLKLSLDNNGITELPNIATNSSNLQELELSFNRLGHVPLSIFKMQNLRKLSLNNNLIAELPGMFDHLPKLQKLILSNNQLRSVPPSIFALQDLSELDLSDNLITELPDIINLPKLHSLQLNNNQLQYVPSEIFEIQNLLMLYLSDNLITELPDKFTNLSKLSKLSLSNNRLRHLPLSICSLHLRELDIESNEFNIEIPPSVGSELIEHSLKELSYRTILNHKLEVEEGILPEKCLKDLANYQQCICGCKFVDEGQDLLFFCNANDISRFVRYKRHRHFICPIRGKMCTSMKSCLPDRFTKCK